MAVNDRRLCLLDGAPRERGGAKREWRPGGTELAKSRDKRVGTRGFAEVDGTARRSAAAGAERLALSCVIRVVNRCDLACVPAARVHLCRGRSAREREANRGITRN